MFLVRVICVIGMVSMINTNRSFFVLNRCVDVVGAWALIASDLNVKFLFVFFTHFDLFLFNYFMEELP